MQRIVLRCLAFVAVALTMWPAARAAAQGRPDCAEVLRTFHNPKVTGHGEGRTPNASKVAHLLGVDADYVERCAEAYGRHVSRHDTLDTSSKIDERVDAEEKRESDEYDEVAPEEKETLGDKYVDTIPDDDQNRKRLGADRNEDDPFEWKQGYEHHDWQPTEDRPWQPYMRTDDE